MSDTLVVLRACGERTEARAAQLLSEQFGSVMVLRLQPLAAAVVAGFKAAESFKWLLTCDADVLIDDMCAERVAEMKRSLPSDHWQALGMVSDKLAGRERKGGLRLYRASMLADKIEHVDMSSIRPEGDLCAMFPSWKQFDLMLGRHDFEQFYIDLYRKGSQHRKKHPSWWRRADEWRTSSDRDLRAAWLGWAGGPMPKWPEKGAL